jgi:hypothetical protein
MGLLDRLFGHRRRDPEDPARETAEARAEMEEHDKDEDKELADELEEEVHHLKGEYPYLGPPREFKPPGTS